MPPEDMLHPLELDRDVFLRSLVRHLAGSLEEVVGLEEASGYISLVGQAMGEEILAQYAEALDTDRLTVEQAAAVMVDLKRRIGGGFSVEQLAQDKIVLVNDACPFGEKVLGRESMCMMTSNVFGHVAAESTGYAKVGLEQTIARGDGGCRVVVHLRDDADGTIGGREYFGTVTSHSGGGAQE